ncbi:MAG: zinc/iron-chelating domain-containing protein [Deltaproteobacteria bacterium HGW-Deltaproteobacteria-8]|nr:MAG: zinc/iron-chelating domain-containing protein [Deltaproteobacteria bacterium HGW-Deltaproteobacteria-8]
MKNTAAATPTVDTANDACRRCGTCCRKGGPALHVPDRHLFRGPDALDLSLVVTLRTGELALDQPKSRLLPLTAEVLKLRGRADAANSDRINGGSGWACPMLVQPDNACALYERRPAECRVLSCRDTTGLTAMYEVARLTRADLLPAGHGLLAVMAEHDALVPPARIAPLAQALHAGGQEALDAQDELMRMALTDRAFRTGLAERADIGPEYHDFFLGRDAATLFAAAGLCLRADARTGLRVQADPLCQPQPTPLSPHLEI